MSAWTDLFGEQVLTKSGLKATADHFQNKSVVGIYFSAHWCPPCRSFTPFLSATYDELVEAHPDVEIVFVSADQDAASFADYFKDMPFAAVPFEDRNREDALSSKFGVSGIPTLIFLNAKGDIITTDGRSVVMEAKGDVEQIWAQLGAAKAGEPAN